MKYIIAAATIVAVQLIFHPQRPASDAAEPEPIEPVISHDVADMPPLETTGMTAVSIWRQPVDCEQRSREAATAESDKRFEHYWKVVRHSGSFALYASAPESLRSDYFDYEDSLTVTANSRKLQAFALFTETTGLASQITGTGFLESCGRQPFMEAVGGWI